MPERSMKELVLILSVSIGLMSFSCSRTVRGGNPQPPVITKQPANQTVFVGKPASFSVVATGDSPLLYEWQKNSATVVGVNSATYTIPATTLADNGATFVVVVKNVSGMVRSQSAQLFVLQEPTVPK